ncbi:hypothetical protein R0381_001421 [Jeongeupia wiesaeckerbachi]|uniref:hypothetical protein n=1 Tax=Jeongeupia wiesaeckerbachi TaxID=3051218 RepID=UPI003D8064F1
MNENYANAGAQVDREELAILDEEYGNDGQQNPTGATSSEAESDQVIELEENESLSEEPESLLKIGICDFSGSPIAGLECKVIVGGKVMSATSGPLGELPEQKFDSGEEIKIYVKKFDGNFKLIHEDVCESGVEYLTLVSPKVVYELKTEKHQGEPGGAGEKIPKPAKKKPAPSEAPKKPDSVSNSANTKPVPKVAGAPSSKPVPPVLGRDKNGAPHAVITEKNEDWWGRWRMAMLNWWSGEDFQKEKSSSTSVTNRAIPSQGVKPSKKQDLELLNTLIAIAEEQTAWFVKDSTLDTLAKMAKKKFEVINKSSSKSEGWCAKYVKLALMRSGVVRNGALTFESGSQGAKQLMEAGFQDVTKDVPDPRWAAPGDVIVYRWNSAAYEKRKKMSRWGGSKAKPNNALFNHGHIEIRTYDGYISDFKGNSGGYCIYSHGKYELVGIYRSPAHDPLPAVRMLAFLQTITDFECEGIPEEKKYFALNTPIDGSRFFLSYAKHPWEGSKEIPRGKTTDAAGAFQIKLASWNDMLERMDETNRTFSPLMQKRAAIALTEQSWRKNALTDIRKGDVDAAVSKLRGEWTSLPGAGENRHGLTLSRFKELYQIHFDKLVVGN